MHIEFRSGQRVSWKSWVFAVVFMLVIAFGGRIYMVFELENECLRTQSNCAAAVELRNNWWKLWHLFISIDSSTVPWHLGLCIGCQPLRSGWAP